MYNYDDNTTVSRGARVLKNFGAPLATKFTYKMRSGGKGMWGRGPALYKHNYLKKKNNNNNTTGKFCLDHIDFILQIV